MKQLMRLIRYGRRFVFDRQYRTRVLDLIDRQVQGASHKEIAPSLEAVREVTFLQKRRVFIIAGCALNFVADYLETFGMEVYHTFPNGRGTDPMTELMMPDSRALSEPWDYYIFSVAQIFRGPVRRMQLDGINYTKEEQEADLAEILDNFRQGILAVREKSAAPIFLFSYFLTYLPTYGIHEYRSMKKGWSLIELWHLFHLRLYELTREFSGVFVLDADLALQAKGKESAINPEESNGIYDHVTRDGGKQIAEQFIRQVSILEPSLRRIKCAVFDLDGTLWAGVLREDGPHGVAVHEYRLNTMEILAARGILLAICSKNDPAEAIHLPDLMGDKLYAKVVSRHLGWSPKSEVLKDIAEELNIGLDSLAFIDDSPFERAEVTANAPEVMVLSPDQIFACPNLPEFQQPGEITPESLSRVARYQQAATRKIAEKSSTRLEDFLCGCELKLEIKAASPADLARIFELLGRTNQLNATLARTSMDDLKKMIESPKLYHLRTARLSDRFGDYGLIGFMSVRKSPSDWQILELAFSCRALGRGVEQAMLAQIAKDALGAGVSSLFIDFLAGARNQQMYQILRQCGFSSLNGADPVEGESIRLNFTLGASSALQFPHWLTVQH